MNTVCTSTSMLSVRKRPYRATVSPKAGGRIIQDPYLVALAFERTASRSLVFVILDAAMRECDAWTTGQLDGRFDCCDGEDDHHASCATLVRAQLSLFAWIAPYMAPR